ncbi:MAG: undecaprenyldiphospho-muramoylpentapeptide beta-N-acetylglucosaminyltransferase [Acidobacteriota bacterium]|nr:undecaprenyldiphospho-muramoylpentapeptide beta-N-acetylglucosaminyltransferase [Acidobacteriota bacterium]
MSYSFVLTGGGTGGHVFPALAVGNVLRERGHRVLFIGTREGMESRLVPAAGFTMDFIRSGGLNRVGLRKQLQTAMGLPGSVTSAWKLLRAFRPAAVFSMGGYVAGPVMLAALLERLPLVVMEPNAVPGFANRRVARRVFRALVGFPETAAWFPKRSTEVTGLPVRKEFFAIQPKSSGPFTVLITGGSRGARTLNRASQESWKLFRESGAPVRIVHQTGVTEYEPLAKEFEAAGLAGEVLPFINDMAEAFSQADLVIGRAGAGAVSEVAAAGMASVLIPLPFAADDHQRRNAEALVKARAARMIPNKDFNGVRLFEEVEALRMNPQELAEMRARVRQFSRPGAAERAADVMEEAAR